MKVNLTYFKETGKYYSTGEYETIREELYEIWDDVRDLQRQGRLPGLVKGAREFIILVEVPEHPHNHPRIIMP